MVTLDQAGAGAASARVLPPPAPLESRVEHAAVEVPAGSPAARGRAWRVVADPCPHLIYRRYPGGRGSRAAVVGPRTRAVDVDKAERSLTVSVRLRPWAMPALFDLSPRELVDRSAPVEVVLGADAKELVERLDEAGPREAGSVLLAWLSGRPARRETPAERAARRAAGSLSRAPTCRAAAEEARVSTRGLRSLMASQVGLSPKTYARVVRLHRALRMMESGRSWARTAVASGYYDQSHMIRDFRELLGETPSAWRRRAASGTPERHSRGASLRQPGEGAPATP